MSFVCLPRSSSALLSFLSSFLLLLVVATSSSSPAAANAHVLIPFSRQRNTAVAAAAAAAARSLDIRSSSSNNVPVAASSGHVFVVNVTVGTPPQPFSLLLSPSSPHTWIPKAGAMPCGTGFDPLSGGFYTPDDLSRDSACKWGAFSESKSSTYRTADQVFLNFVVAYTDTINVSGVNMTDQFRLGDDIELADFAMGLVDSASDDQWIGMLGLGNDATTLFPRPSSRYRPNLVDRLVADGKIASQAYSIWLDDAEGRSGSLLLGAVDKSRYDGDLIRLHAVKPYDIFPSAFAVSVTSIQADGDKGFQHDEAEEPGLACSLSPAETFSYLPDALAEQVMTATGAVWNSTLQRATIPCDAGSRNGPNPDLKLRLQLEGTDGPVLNVHMADLVISPEVTRWEIARATSALLGRNTCLFGIQKLPDALKASTSRPNPQYNLGSSLLRRTYMVFDNVNKDLALAPTKSGASSSGGDIVPFAAQGARIPGSKLYCVGDNTACPQESDSPDDDPSGSGSGGSGGGGGSSSNTNVKAIVIGVVVPIVVLAIVIPLVYILLVKRRKTREAKRREQWEAERAKHESGNSVSGDGEDSFAEDEFGVKVTVSVSSKVSLAKPPLPSPASEVFLGLPGALPVIAEEHNRKSGSQQSFWGDAVLRPSGSAGSGGSRVSGGQTLLSPGSRGGASSLNGSGSVGR